jgi:hypothetical protein
MDSEKTSREQENINKITGVTKPPGLKELGDSYILEESTQVRTEKGDLVTLPRGTRVRGM